MVNTGEEEDTRDEDTGAEEDEDRGAEEDEDTRAEEDEDTTAEEERRIREDKIKQKNNIMELKHQCLNLILEINHR